MKLRNLIGGFILGGKNMDKMIVSDIINGKKAEATLIDHQLEIYYDDNLISSKYVAADLSIIEVDALMRCNIMAGLHVNDEDRLKKLLDQYTEGE